MKHWPTILVALTAGLCAAGAVVVMAPPRLDAAVASGLRSPDEALEVRLGGRPTDLEGLEKHVSGLRRNDLYAWRWLGEAYRARGQSQRAEAAWRRSLELSEGLVEEPDLSGHAGLWFSVGWCRWRLGDQSGAVRAMGRAEELLLERAASARRAPAQSWASIGYCRRVRGDEAGAREAWARALEIFERSITGIAQGPGDLYDLARYRALAGDAEGALADLDRAVEVGWRDVGAAEWNADLESLRGDARLAEVLRRAGGG